MDRVSQFQAAGSENSLSADSSYLFVFLFSKLSFRSLYRGMLGCLFRGRLAHSVS